MSLAAGLPRASDDQRPFGLEGSGSTGSDDAAEARWPLWSTIARLVVTDPAALPAAVRLARIRLAQVEAACSRFDPDSELMRLYVAGGGRRRVSPLLAQLLTAALEAARRTGGDVDPTLGNALNDLGYDRDYLLIRPDRRPVRIPGARGPAWRRVRVDGDVVTLPVGVCLDLGATAKAVAADLCADEIARQLGVGVLVDLGGDVATAGPAPVEGWWVLLRDRPGDAGCRVRIPAGSALATSGTTTRQWQRAGVTLHHILDPRTGHPVPEVWRTVSVAAATCLHANTLSTAAVVRGHRALPWLRDLGATARLVTASGEVVNLGGRVEAACG